MSKGLPEGRCAAVLVIEALRESHTLRTLAAVQGLPGPQFWLDARTDEAALCRGIPAIEHRPDDPPIGVGIAAWLRAWADEIDAWSEEPERTRKPSPPAGPSPDPQAEGVRY